MPDITLQKVIASKMSVNFLEDSVISVQNSHKREFLYVCLFEENQNHFATGLKM